MPIVEFTLGHQRGYRALSGPALDTYHVIRSLVIEAMRLSRYQVPRDYLGIPIKITNITLHTDYEYVVSANVVVCGPPGFMVLGSGIAVKGRKDRFSTLHGAKCALRRALLMAFNILGQMERTPPARRGSPDLAQVVVCVGDWTNNGVELLSPSHSRVN